MAQLQTSSSGEKPPLSSTRLCETPIVRRMLFWASAHLHTFCFTGIEYHPSERAVWKTVTSRSKERRPCRNSGSGTAFSGRLSLKSAQDSHGGECENLGITFNDGSTKLYVFRMQMRSDGVVLRVADSFTHREKGAVLRVDDQQKSSRGFQVFSSCTDSGKTSGEGWRLGDQDISGRSVTLHDPGKLPAVVFLDALWASITQWLTIRLMHQPTARVPNARGCDLVHRVWSRVCSPSVELILILGFCRRVA